MSTENATTAAQTPPKYIRIDFDRMPPELKSLKNWLIWAAVWNGSKWTKRPIQISGYGANTTNSKHWSTFAEVKRAYEHAVQRGHMELRERGKPVQQVPIGGVGFVFDGQTDADGLVFAGVDFDKVITGREIASLAEERIKRLGSYTERSVSGGGLHVILKARPLSSGITHDGVEMYTSGRYFTMTGRAPENARIVAAPEPFAALANELQSLPGNGAQAGTGSAAANGQQEKFTAADRERLRKLFEDSEGSLSDGIKTNIEEIRSAVSSIPPSAIAAEPDWMKFARALAHEAAVYKGQSEELWIILDSASRAAPGYNEAENRVRWLRLIGEAFDREKPITIATVFDLARKHGWRGWSPSGTTENTSDASEAETGSTTSPPPDLKFSLSDVPPHRPWLYGVDLVRGDLSVLASMGGAGKTSLAIGMAISLASGNALLGEQIWGSGPFTSLYINAEDSGVEMRRRALAFCQQHNITALERLYIAGTDDLRVRGLAFLRPAGQNSSVLDQAGLQHLDNLLGSLQPDLVVIDPLVALCGGGNVNDNAAMALVMREIKRLAIKFNCSILIVHHTRKGGEPGSADAISGASAIKDLARCARMPVTMTTAEMGIFHVLPSERQQHFKLVDAKSNLALHSDEAWYKLESQELPNAGTPYLHGDRVQAVVRVQLSAQPGGSANVDDMKIEAAILNLVDRGKEIDGQAYPYSPSLAGAKNERAILQDAMTSVANSTAPRQWALVDLEAVTKNAIKRMLDDGRLVVETVEDLMLKPGRFRRGRGLKSVAV
jgi:AAA domain/Primase C terminal 2 (PriCT-2)